MRAMPVFDTDQLLEPVRSDMPAGDPLDSDPAFLALETLSQGTPERVMGDVIVPAEEPNWASLRDQAISLLERSKDLRVSILLLRALLHTDAIPGISAGLRLVRGLVERYWATLHPLPDEDDPTDHTERAMAFAALTDRTGILSPLERTPLVSARGLGSPSLRDIRAAQTGTLPTDPREAPDAAAITAAFDHCEIDQLRANAEAATEATQNGKHLAVALAALLPPDNAPDLSPLLALLESIETILRAHLVERQPFDRTGVNSTRSEGLISPENAEVTSSGAKPPSGPVTSRTDVQRALAEICKYYAQHEPSSPIPLLLQRAQRLVNMSFVDIVQDLIPESIDKINALKGAEDRTS